MRLDLSKNSSNNVTAILIKIKIKQKKAIMGYVIDYNPDKKFVSITVKGKVDFKQAEQYSGEAVKLAHTNNCHKFLIDHTKTKLEAGIYKIHTDGAALEKFGFKSNDKIAIVILRDKDSGPFFGKKVYDIKWSNFKYFDNVKEAVDWIAGVD